MLRQLGVWSGLAALASISACSQYELAEFAAVAAPVATYSALSGYVLDSAFEEFDNAGGGAYPTTGTTRREDLRPASYRISAPCIPSGGGVCSIP